MKRIPTTLAAVLTASAVLVATTQVAATGLDRSVAHPESVAHPGRLTNLDHLDFLGDTVAPPAQEHHTTYRLPAEPQVGVLWTYADHQADGSYKRLGGGTCDRHVRTGRVQRRRRRTSRGRLPAPLAADR
jgi:hypothetical protein